MTRELMVRAVVCLGLLAFAWWGAGPLGDAIVTWRIPEDPRAPVPFRPLFRSMLAGLSVLFAFGLMLDGFRGLGRRR